MGFILRDELTKTPPKLSLYSFHHRKPPPEPPLGALTPPLQPMVSIPFHWEEAPGRPKPTSSSPFRPNCSKCLQLPPAPRKVSNNIDNYGPRLLCSLDPSPNEEVSSIKGNEVISHFESCGWANGKAQKWGLEVSEIGFSVVSPGNNDVDIEVKITRFRRSKRSLYELSHKSTRLFENIYQSLKQMVVRRHTNKRSQPARRNDIH